MDQTVKNLFLMGFRPWPHPTRIQQYFLSALVILLSAILCHQLSQALGYYIVSFIFLIIVSALATFMSTGPVILASLMSILIWNFFFIPPHNTFHIEKTEDILMFGMFGLVVLLNGVYTTRVRRQEQFTRQRESHTNALFKLTNKLSKAVGLEEVLRVSQEEIRQCFPLNAFIINMLDSSNLVPFEQVKPGFDFSPENYEVAKWSFANSKKAGKHSSIFQQDNYTYYPLCGTLINPGVLVTDRKIAMETEERVFWGTFLAQISGALEREMLGELARRARFLDESDRFYKTLFNSVSHELRIPLATILAASDTLRGSPSSSDMGRALAQEMYQATNRLNRLIENLLNMSRLESGRIALRMDWYDLNDLVNKVFNDLKEELKTFNYSLRIPEDMPLIRFDFGLMEQVLYNLVYNSCHYATGSSEIVVVAGYQEGRLILSVADRGPGFPETTLENVFDKFFRVDEKGTGGLGLGLSIVKGFVEAHQGDVRAENRPGGGAVLTVIIPSEKPEIVDLKMDEKHDG